MNIKDVIIRALKTFVQAAIPIFAANFAVIQSHIASWDWGDWKAWLLPIILSAVAAGISAVWNLIIQLLSRWSEKDDEPVNFDVDDEEEVIEAHNDADEADEKDE